MRKITLMTNDQSKKLNDWFKENYTKITQTCTLNDARTKAIIDLGFKITEASFRQRFYKFKKTIDKNEVVSNKDETKSSITDQLIYIAGLVEKLEKETIPHSDCQKKIDYQVKIIEELKASSTRKELHLMDIISEQKNEILRLKNIINNLEEEVDELDMAIKHPPTTQIKFKINY